MSTLLVDYYKSESNVLQYHGISFALLFKLQLKHPRIQSGGHHVRLFEATFLSTFDPMLIPDLFLQDKELLL